MHIPTFIFIFILFRTNILILLLYPKHVIKPLWYNLGCYIPLIRGIKHQIDFFPGATIPNQPAYRSNPEETKELQKQVSELMEKGYLRESLSPCVVPVILVRNIMVKIRGRIFSRKGGMIRIKAQRRSMLLPKGDGPFQVIERINDNAYKLNFPNECGPA